MPHWPPENSLLTLKVGQRLASELISGRAQAELGQIGHQRRLLRARGPELLSFLRPADSPTRLGRNLGAAHARPRLMESGQSEAEVRVRPASSPGGPRVTGDKERRTAVTKVGRIGPRCTSGSARKRIRFCYWQPCLAQHGADQCLCGGPARSADQWPRRKGRECAACSRR